MPFDYVWKESKTIHYVADPFGTPRPRRVYTAARMRVCNDFRLTKSWHRCGHNGVLGVTDAALFLSAGFFAAGMI